MSNAPQVLLARKWSDFISERFPLAAHGPMVVAFTLGNFAFAARLGVVACDWWHFAAGVALAFSFFFRLRCFDEIKDYAVDVAVNPTRPLARGLLTVVQVKHMLVALTLFEVIVSALLGAAVFWAHALAVVYSFLMYKEFFVGRWLRPHLTTYALTHTWVSVLLGLSLAVQATGIPFQDLPRTALLAAVVNWFMFNLFEFARKTFAAAEERPHVDSYSSLFGGRGAVCLSLSQIALAAGLVAWVASVAAVWSPAAQTLGLVLTALPVLAAAVFLVAQNKPTARLFRGTVSAYLILFYVYLAWLGVMPFFVHEV